MSQLCGWCCLFILISLLVSHFENVELTDVSYLVVYCIVHDNIYVYCF